MRDGIGTGGESGVGDGGDGGRKADPGEAQPDDPRQPAADGLQEAPVRLPDAVHPIDPLVAAAVEANPGTGAAHPPWTAQATLPGAYLRGIREAPVIPALILGVTFIGFGAMTKDAGLTLPQSVMTTLSIFAMPGQVMLVDQIARGAGLFAAAFAVSVTAIRLLPLTVALMPHIRRPGQQAWVEYGVAHLVTVTLWLESMRRLPKLPPRLRVPYYFGLGTVLLGLSAIGTATGFVMAAQLPQQAAAGLMLMTPLYFLMGLTASALGTADRLAILLGLILAPLLHLAAPTFDLLLTGLIGGTLTYLLARWRRWQG